MAVINAVGKYSQTPYPVEIAGETPTPEEQGRIDAYISQQEAPYAQIYQEYFGASEPSETIDIPEGLDENTYRTALRQGYQMIKSRGGTAIEYAGKGLGSDIIEEFGEGVTDKAEARLNELGSMVDRTTFSEVEGVGSAGRFAGELAAEQAPQLGLSAAGTYIGGGIGGTLGLVGGPAGVIAGSSLGAYLGTALTSGPLLFGGDIQRQEGQVAKGELERVDAAKALLATFGQVGLETVANAILVLKPIKALGKGGLFARTAKTGATGAAAEGLTEIGQQMIERKQAGLEWDPTKSDEALQEYIEAGVAGGILGGGLGGAGAAFRGDLSQQQKDKELEADIEALEAENTIKRDRGIAAAQRSPTVTREGEATTEGLYGDPVADPDVVVTPPPEEQAALDAQAEVDTLAEAAKVSKAQELQLKIKDPTKLPQDVRTEALRSGIAQKGDSRPDIIKKIKDMAAGGSKVARAPSKAMRGKQDRKLGTRTQKKGGYDQRAFDAAVNSVKSLGKFSPKAVKEALEKAGTKPNQKVTTGSRPSNRSTTTALAEVKSEMIRRGIISDDNKATYQNPEAVDTADNAAQVEADLYLKEMERDKLRAESDAIFKAVQETEAREKDQQRANKERAETGQANVDPSEFGSFAPKQTNVFNRLREMLTKMGMSDVKLEAETGFIDGMAEGSFAGTTKTIALAVGVYDPNMNEDQLFEAVAEVMNHETIHALRSLGVITAKELKVLAKAAANTKYAHKDGTKREYTYLDRAKRLYGNLSQTKEQDGTPSQVDEEAIAEMFRDYAAGRLKIGGSPRNIFGKIKRFLLKLMRKANKAGYSRPQDIFDAIISGEVGSRKTERQLGGESGPTTASSTGDPRDSRAFSGSYQDGRQQQTVESDGRGQASDLSDDGRGQVKRSIATGREGTATATQQAQLPVTGTDLSRLSDVSFLKEFLKRPGWTVITGTREINKEDPQYKNTDLNSQGQEIGPLMLEIDLKKRAIDDEKANDRLEQYFVENDIPYEMIQGIYLGQDQGRNFLAVVDVDEATRLGRSYGQESVLTNDGLVYSNPRPDTLATGQVKFGEEALAEEFYSVIKGTPFSMGLDFDTGLGNPVIPEGYFTSEARPQLPLRDADGKVELHHWSGRELSEIDPEFAGTGPLQGDERRRGAKTTFFGINPKQNQRSQGTGYVKESGLGANEHIVAVDPNRLYPWNEDPDGILPSVYTNPNGSKSDADYEAKIKSAGYLGFYITESSTNQSPHGNTAGLFYKMPVESVESRDSIRSELLGKKQSLALTRSFIEFYDGQNVVPKVNDKNGNAVDPDYVYRTMSRKEYDSIEELGELTNTGMYGRIHASASPLPEFSNKVDDTVTVKIKYDRNDGWKAKYSGSGEVYAVTEKAIPSSKIEPDKVQLNQKFSRAIPLTKEQYDASILDYLDPKTGKPVFKSPAGDNTLVEFARKIAKLRLTPQYDVMNSEADREALAQIAAAEAEAALISGSDALGWYDATLKLAKQILYPVYPEISPIKPDGSANPAYDEAAEHAFDYATAVTSNGLAVIDNYSLAAKAYDIWSKTGRWDDGMASGKQGKSMQKAWMFWNALSDQGMNSQQIKQLLNTQIPRGQINNILKQVFDVKSISELPVTPDASEEAGTTVSIAYVIGPKIGNGFYQNLNGNYDPLTMDRWWMRFFNRISGDMIEVFDEAKLNRSRDDLFDILQGRSEILSEMDKAIIKTVRRELGVKKLLKKDLDLIAPKIQATFDREYFKKTYNNTMEELDNASPETRYNFEVKGTKVIGPDADIVKKIAQDSRPKNTKMIRTANTLAKKLKPTLQEQPRTAQDRTAMKDVANRARKILKDQLGVDITNADFQALMWYAEKRIFEAGGVRKGRGEDNDYADGALALLKERGIADATIKNTLPAAERGRFDNLQDDQGADSEAGKPVKKLTAAQRKQIKELESESPKFFEPREIALSKRRISDDLTSEEMVAVDKALSEMPLDPNMVQKKLSAAPTNPYRMVRTPTQGEPDYVYGNIYEDGKKKPVFLLEGADDEGVGFGLYHIQQKRPEDTRSHEQEFQEFYGYDNASEAIYEVMKLWSKQGNRDGKNVTSSIDPRNGRLALVWNKAPKYPVKIVISKFNPVTKREASEKDARLGNFLYSILTSYPETPKQSRKSSAAFSTSYAAASGTSNATAMNNQMMRYTTISDFLAKQINRFTSDKSVGQKAADKFFQKIQDSFLPVGRVIDDLKRLGATITDAMDPYLQQQLSVGITGDKIATRKDTIYRDVAKAVNKMRISDRQIDNLVQVSNNAARQYASNNGMQGASEGLAAYNMKDPQSKSLSLLDTYLYAKHAKERNAYVRSIDSTNDMGSGMSDLEADAIINWFDTQLVPRDRNAIAEGERAIRAIVKDTNDERFAYGLQPDQATLNSNGPNYQFYVPLKGHMEMDEESGTSSVPSTPKYGAKGREDQRVMGRRSYGRDVSFNAMLQNTDTITRGERNKVGQSWLELVRNEPAKMQSYGEILQQKPSRRVMKNGQVVMAVDPNYKTRDDILVVKEGGNEIVYQFYPDQLNLAGAFTGKNVWTAQNANVILRGTQKLNRWLSNINTSWNPEFLISNLARDIQAAGISLGEFDAKGLQSTVMTNVPKAIAGMKRSIRNGDDSSDWAKKYKEFRAAGGASAANPMNSLADQIGNLGDVLNDMSDAGGKSRAAWNKAGKPLVKAMEDYNLIFENSVRVTTFHALKDAGVSPERAAQAARSVTVDFGKSGDWGGFVNSLYLFYNASLQGSFFFLRSLSRMPKAKLAKYVGGIMAVGALMDSLNAAMSDEDEDGIKEVDKVQDYVAEHNWVIMTPFLEDTPYLSLPMPYGMNMLYNTGRAASQYVRGGKRLDQASSSIGRTLLEVVNPLGGSEHFLNFAAPTIADPFISLYGTNKDFAGRPLIKTAFPNQIASDASLYWSSTSPTAVSIANSLNELTGGSDAVSGWIDWSPDSLEFWYDYITGATGKTIQRAAEIGPKLASADNAEDFWNTVGRDFPMARKLIGNIGDSENLSVYIDKRDRINVARQELKNAYEAGDRERFEAAKERYPDEIRAIAGMRKAEAARRKNSQRVNIVKNAQNITEERREQLLSQLREQKKKIISFGIRAAANI